MNEMGQDQTVLLPPAKAPVAPQPAPSKGFWGNVGSALAKIGGAFLSGALWASNHPAVIEAVAKAAGKPAVAAAVGQFAPAASAVLGVAEQAVQAKAGK